MTRRLSFWILLLGLFVAGCTQAPQPGPTPTPKESPVSVDPSFVPADRKTPPLSLTAQDGTGLKLVSLSARAVLEGPLAFTQLRMIFENPENRVIEGRFQVTLPEGAALSRLSMKLDQGWQEAEVVELQAARVAYEDALHRRQDPALLEKQAGNEFQARIFPIPARGRKEIILSYSQELPGATPYRLPLQGLPRMSSLEITALVGKPSDGTLRPEELKVTRQGYVPEGDFEIPQQSSVSGLTHQGLAVVRVRPDLHQPESEIGNLVVLVDTSASRALGFEAQLDKLQSVLQALQARGGSMEVACFDQTVEPVFSGDVGALPDKVRKAMLERRALGATDFSAALDWARERKGKARLLLVTDGVATAGKEALQELTRDFERVDVILMGGIRDREKMGQLVRSGVVLDGAQPADVLARRLRLTAASGIPVRVEDAQWIWPEVLDGVQPGDERLVYIQLKKPAQSLAVEVGKQSTEIPLLSAPRPLLERSVAVARVASLENQLGEEKDAKKQASLRAEIVKLSTSQRVLSSLTALLVLETEADYQRFGIDRKSLIDILEVGEHGLELVNRNGAVVYEPVVERKRVGGEPHLEADGDAPAGPRDRERGVGGELAQAGNGGGVPSSESVTISEEEVSEGYGAAPPRQNALSPTVPRPAPASVEAPGGPASGQPIPDSSVSNERRQTTTGALSERVRVNDDIDAGAEFSAGDFAQHASRPRPEPVPVTAGPAPLEGKLAEVHRLLEKGKKPEALQKALAWHASDPGDVLALVALAESFEAAGKASDAARAYGSIIDLFPSRTDLRRFAGCRLEALGAAGGDLAVDTYRKAVEQRPDHPSSHRLLAFALARQGDLPAAFAAIETGLKRPYPPGRFLSYDRILRDDAGLIGAAWAARDPKARDLIAKRLSALGATMATEPSLRFVLTWETDANDVDFHIQDGKQGHAYYSSPHLGSGGDLYGDVTTGYGPECFNIPGKPTAYPYHLTIHYYSRGPMGYGMGKVEVIEHDGRGGLVFEQRPYVVMTDRAFVDLGVVKGPLQRS